jgi:TfoX/Sxy family transcriptional regulator of competence genes
MAKEYLEKLSAFIDVATAEISGDIHLECKHFFSGAALYAEERICISLTPVGLALKFPEATKNKLLKNKKAVPLRYFEKGPIKKDYVLFPNGIEKGGKAMHKYVKESIEYALTLPKPKRKKK